MTHLTLQQAAEQWQLPADTILRRCQTGAIADAVCTASGWRIPSDALPPAAAPKSPMPLMNTAFTPGRGLDTVIAISDMHQRRIALAEYYYFSGRAEAAASLAESYLSHPQCELRLSACLIYAYASLALGSIAHARLALTAVRDTLSQTNSHTPPALRAAAVFIDATAAVLLHLPPSPASTELRRELHLLPPGLRQFALYVQAHNTYLQGDHAKSLGIVETALAVEPATYPIPAIYLHLIAVMNAVALKDRALGEQHLLTAWRLAQPDDLIEPFGEHHGLLGGMLEAIIKPQWPDDFKRIIDITYRFSAGWRRVHNPISGHDVADNLSTTEFSICMLAARGWSNQEIADHLSLSLHTVKTHLTKAFKKLGIKHRKDLGKHMLR